MSAQSLISGIINQYTSVSAINAGTSTLTVGDASLFSFDDRVLLIQMQGAVINSGNSSTYGTISNLNGAGAYEFAAVCEVNLGTNEIVLQKPLVNSYTPTSVSTASIQLITVPQYTDVNIVGTLLAQDWNGSTGGIIAFEATGTVRLEADVDVDGAGFRGGGFEDMPPPPNCTFLTNSNDWYYNQASELGGKKGEGIATYISGREYGRGPQANGGGGGNNHNAGGAGGGNYQAGGQGGERSTTTFNCQGDHEGEGGISLSSIGYSPGNPYVFLGGGGGSGHANSNQGKDGGNGGGIVMIRCQTFNGNNFFIHANGEDALDSDSDGGAGGGAGGVIMLSADFYTGDPFTLEATGGNGGDTDINCEGPGGGGAGGLIWVSNALGAGVTRNVSAGAAGQAVACGNSTLTASNGSSGAELVTLNLIENTGNATCILPIIVSNFDVEIKEAAVYLSWESLEEEVGTSYTIERSQDGQLFQELIRIPGKSIGSATQSYAYVDALPYPNQSWYRLAWQSPSGSLSYSDIKEVQLKEGNPLSVQLFPNPITSGKKLHGWIDAQGAGTVFFRIFSLQGQLLHTQKQRMSAGRNDFKLQTEKLPAAMYLLRITSQHDETALSFLIQD